MPVDDLRVAWGRWDASPGDPTAARRMIDACRAVAVQLGLGYVPFRAQTQRLRRSGLTIDQVISRIETRLQQSSTK